MDFTDHAGALPAPEHPSWVRRLEKGLVIVTAVTLGLIVALGLVAIGFFVIFLFAMNNYGSNK
jgi:hypothetical protein